MTSTSLPGLGGVDDHVAHTAGHAQDLADGHAAAVGAGHQSLGDHALDRAGDHAARLGVLVGREEVEHAVDRLGRVDGVDRREHEVPGLGGRQRRLDGLLVAHLADQDHVGVLAQHPSQRALEGGGVHADFALVDHRALVRVHELDRVLDRHDVLGSIVWFMWSIIAASVVDLPEPVVPVSSTIPRSSSASSLHDGRQRELFDRADLVGIARQASEISPRWRKALIL